MVAVRSLFSTLNDLAHSGLLASGWLRLPDRDGATAPADEPDGDFPTELGPYAQAGVEPSLEELLDDPVIRLMMRADHQELEQLRALLSAKQQAE